MAITRQQQQQQRGRELPSGSIINFFWNNWQKMWHSARALLLAHYEALLVKPDAVEHGEPELGPLSNKQQTISVHFILLLAVYFATVIDGFVFLPLEYEPIDWRNFAQYFGKKCCPQAMLHQMMTPDVWQDTDYIMLFSMMATVAVFTVMVFRSSLPPRYRYYAPQSGATESVIIGHRTQPLEISRKIRRTSQIGRRAVRYMALFLNIFFIVLLCLFNVFVMNRVYLLTFHSMFYWLIVFPIYFGHMAFVVLCVMIFPVMSSRYVCIRQDYVFDRLRKLNGKLSRKRNPSEPFLHRCRLAYDRLNRELARICEQTSSYSRFWCPLISVMFVFYIVDLSYLIYPILFWGKPTSGKNGGHFATITNILFSIIVVIWQCASIVKLNERIHAQNRQFYINFAQRNRHLYRNQASILLKLESRLVSNRLRPYAFKIYPNYRITSKTFNTIFVYIAFFFMFVHKSK